MKAHVGFCALGSSCHWSNDQHMHLQQLPLQHATSNGPHSLVPLASPCMAWDGALVTNNIRAGVCIAGSTLNHWPFPWNHLGEAHAYQLTHCGTPCVFYDHFMNADLQKSIKALLKIRKRHGISNRSKVTVSRTALLLGRCLRHQSRL